MQSVLQLVGIAVGVKLEAVTPKECNVYRSRMNLTTHSFRSAMSREHSSMDAAHHVSRNRKHSEHRTPKGVQKSTIREIYKHLTRAPRKLDYL